MGGGRAATPGGVIGSTAISCAIETTQAGVPVLYACKPRWLRNGVGCAPMHGGGSPSPNRQQKAADLQTGSRYAYWDFQGRE
jgi:hypothetical protein